MRRAKTMRMLWDARLKDDVYSSAGMDTSDWHQLPQRRAILWRFSQVPRYRLFYAKLWEPKILRGKVFHEDHATVLLGMGMFMGLWTGRRFVTITWTAKHAILSYFRSRILN